MKYKVLSVRQPYASLLVKGIKDVENRSRKTNFRGTILIHAGAKMHDVVEHLNHFIQDAVPLYGIEKDIWREADYAVAYDRMSAIVGSVDIIDCVQNHPSEWAEKGQWHWVCANAKKFKYPIRNVKGKLGIWEWEGELSDDLYEKSGE